MIELLMVVVIVLVLTSIAYPRIARSVAATRSENAARIAAADLRSAVALATRQGTPVRVSFDSINKVLTIRDRATSAVLQTRAFGARTEFPVQRATANPSQVDIYPTRVTSAPLTLFFVTPVRTTQVTMSRAGLVRIQ